MKIDEKLQAFRGRCSFRRYIPSKPAKYGIKMYAMVDNISYFTSNMEIYAGKQPDGPFSIDNSTKNVVHRLIQPIRNTGRIVTIDNWFTSVPLADELLNQKLTLLCTLRKNKTQVPPEFKITKNRPIFSSYFGFCEKKVLLSYKPINNKIVLLLSTMHNDNSIDNSTGAAKKPNMITMYL